VPRLVKSIDGVEQPRREFASLGLNENNLRVIRRAMFSATNDRRGTAYGSRIVEEGRRMAGKTGTSQVRNITAAERARGVFRNEDLPWNRRDHALYVAFAPEDVPQIAVSVVVEHGGGGSAAAAPIARDVVLQALYGGLPPLSAYPESQRPRIRTMQEELPLDPPDTPAGGATRA
jgi:penicillin-binding protein 2